MGVYADPDIEHEVICAKRCGCLWIFDQRHDGPMPRDRKAMDCNANGYTATMKAVVVATYRNDTCPAIRWQ